MTPPFMISIIWGMERVASASLIFALSRLPAFSIASFVI
ncbi:MAG: hypothetical protein A4E40_00601 [Methanoregulaceae archaeon PtaU1.Bin059]|nr:MAG: hypothetical protein A4E40_00601 [Methanoregulaceae archaeon PtaU1.Bin059]